MNLLVKRQLFSFIQAMQSDITPICKVVHANLSLVTLGTNCFLQFLILFFT